MSITLSEKEKRTLITIIQERIDDAMSLFPFARFPIEPLDEWRRIFCDPATVPLETIRQAIAWAFGGWQRKDLSLAHRKIIAEISKAWPESTQLPAEDPEQALVFWHNNLSDWNHGFSAVSFLLHLQHPNAFEIVDRHRLDAMLELLKAIGHAEQESQPELTFSQLQEYTDFFRAIFPKLSYGNESRIKLDRFLKIYGNRHAYSNIPDDYKSKEATIRSFSWDSVSSERFRIDDITNRANADVLFACFLLTLEAETRPSDNLTIGEIIDRLPLGTGGLCNPASFNYALVSLFSGQKQRDYWIFQNPELKRAFTKQANNSTRDMRFYLKHAAEKISVNPKFVNAKG